MTLCGPTSRILGSSPESAHVPSPILHVQAGEIKGLSVRLDESRFCSRCAPKGAPLLLGLVVRMQDGTEVHTVPACGWDLILLYQFTTPLAQRKGLDAQPILPQDRVRLAELLGNP